MLSLKKTLISSLFIAKLFAVPVVAADLSAGEQKASSCFGCHGQKGISSISQLPNLAAQQPAYLVNQLKAFKSGNRSNATMEAIAKNLDIKDMENISAYFSSQKPAKITTQSAAPKSSLDNANICLGCHGVDAEGKGQFPKLAGQHPDYLEQQLKNFKVGLRKNGPMQAITANLNESEIKALAAYFGSL